MRSTHPTNATLVNIVESTSPVEIAVAVGFVTYSKATSLGLFAGQASFVVFVEANFVILAVSGRLTILIVAVFGRSGFLDVWANSFGGQRKKPLFNS